MKQVIFYSDTCFPYSILAASIRTGRLPADRCPNKSELENALSPYGMGKGDARIFSLESSTGDEKCLALWTAGQGDMVKRTITSFLSLYHINNYMLINLKYKRTPVMIIGTWLTRVPLLRSTGLNLVHRSVKKIYNALVKISTGYIPGT